MLFTREELRFDFKGALFDVGLETDRKWLCWIFDQFLYGEATGIQCGQWLYRAPSVNAAVFMAKQAGEELSHLKRIARIFSILGEKPQKAHWAIQFLATGMTGRSWGEHVTIEMALGEGLVLCAFYAMADTIDHPEIKRILSSMIVEEERHVDFGEKEAITWLKDYPEFREMLLGQALVQAAILSRIKNFILKKIAHWVGPDHPVMGQFGEFYQHVLCCFERRIERMGLSEQSVSTLGFVKKMKTVSLLPLRLMKLRLQSRTPLLTETYLDDPALLSELQKFPLSSSVHE